MEGDEGRFERKVEHLSTSLDAGCALCCVFGGQLGHATSQVVVKLCKLVPGWKRSESAMHAGTLGTSRAHDDDDDHARMCASLGTSGRG